MGETRGCDGCCGYFESESKRFENVMIELYYYYCLNDQESEGMLAMIFGSSC